MRKWCRFVCTTIAGPILESYRIMPSHRLWQLWPPTSDLVIPTLGRNMWCIWVASVERECWLWHFCRHIPHFGPSLQAPFKEYLVKQKRKLHHKRGTSLPTVCFSYDICAAAVLFCCWSVLLLLTYRTLHISSDNDQPFLKLACLLGHSQCINFIINNH